MSQHQKGPLSHNVQNRLANAQSPYLLQHARNPVDWYPWGPEAFAKAKKENKPIFLSIGYSTCHWCHVMAHESFEDSEVAALMNEAFVNIKVDREERPDIDSIYMTVCQMMTRQGGWPLTIIMSPDKKPFFAATYIPKESRFGRVGMMELIPKVSEVWREAPEEIERSTERILEALKDVSSPEPGEALTAEELGRAFNQLSGAFDEDHGGFNQAPKFPTPHNLLFLLRYGKRTGKAEALEMVETTLRAMRRGGVYDHVGFGFHRYATDREWLLPHFEKMLYDQAMLTLAFIEAYQATGNRAYEETAREIFTYVLRDLTAPEGGFYSAEDADSEGEEGKFYVWTREEITKVLGEEEGDLVSKVFNVEQEGNFTEEASGLKTEANILHLTSPLEEIAKDLDLPLEKFKDRLEGARQRLFEAREKRIHPHKDDKVLTDWNALMIAAFARGARVFREPEYEEAARRAADFLLDTLRTPEGRLLHRYRKGVAGIMGNLDDHAFLIFGLLHLYEATFEVRYLETALDLNKELVSRFWDEEAGAFFFTADDAEDLIVRRKEIYDGAIPSGNSVAMLNLVRLSRITGNTAYEERAQRIGMAFSREVSQYPMGHTMLMTAVDFAMAPSFEVVLAGVPGREDTEAMVRALRKHHLPYMVVLFRPSGEGEPAISRIADYTRGQDALEGRATAYVCRNFNCELPTNDPVKMLELLGVK